MGTAIIRPTQKTLLCTSVKNSFYKPGKKTFNECQQSAHKYYGLVGLGLGFGLVLRLGSV